MDRLLNFQQKIANFLWGLIMMLCTIAEIGLLVWYILALLGRHK